MPGRTPTPGAPTPGVTTAAAATGRGRKTTPGLRALEKAAASLDREPETGIVCSLVEFFGSRRGRFIIPDFSLQDMLVAEAEERPSPVGGRALALPMYHPR